MTISCAAKVAGKLREVGAEALQSNRGAALKNIET